MNFSLGGTSLINANVALEADDRIWQMSAWPEEINDDYDSIKRGNYQFSATSKFLRVFGRHLK
jgi:hypothetical protein